MTELVRRDGPNYHSAAAGMTMHLQKTVHLPPVDSGAITTATVIKAAWEYVLAQVTCTPDVVFGHTISGRNASVDGVANMIGPCVNLLPVRVQFAANSTVKEVFHQIQDQQVANMAHEVIGFRDIIRHCTSWPNWTYFTSTVQHQNLEPNNTVHIGGMDYRLGCASTDQGDFSDLDVVSQLSPTAGENMYEITLSFTQDGPIPHTFAEHVLNVLCDSAESLAKDPGMALPSPTESSNTLTQLSLPDTPPQTNPTLDDYASLLEATSQPHFDALYERVISAWRQVGVPDDEDLDKSFFDCGGDVVQLAQLSWFLAHQGVGPRLEDLVARPSVRGHMALFLAGGGGG
jgi:non-ribosomal peptide synthetase component F